MKMMKSPNEKGQILILLSAGIVALLAFAVLAIDGGMILFDRRNAQNAADAAALAGAYQLARDPHSADKAETDPGKIALIASVESAAGARADDNLYGAASGKSIIVTYPPDPAAIRYVPGDTNINHYVRVEITSTVRTSFMHLVYSGIVRNTVESVAHVSVPERGNPFPGSAMVALAPTECATANGTGGGIYFGGSGWTNLIGGGMFVNSDANCSVDGPGGSYFVYTPSLVDVGQVDGSVNNLIVQPGPDERGATSRALSYPPTDYLDPPTCTGTAVLSATNLPHTSEDGTTHTYKYELSAGNYDEVLPNDDVWFTGGKYCFTNPDHKSIISLNNTQWLGGNNVLIYTTGYNPCDFKWNGGNTVKLHGYTEETSPYKGVLIYVDPKTYSPASTGDGEGPMQFNGSADSYIIGTVYAPSCTAVLSGTDGNMYQGQMIAYNIVITGTQSFNMDFKPEDNVEIQGEAKVDLAE
jgi:hypothetical protein